MALLREVSKQRRHLRRPQHIWNVRAKPWVIQPTMIAPVLPGETLESLTMQVRAVSDPIRNPLIGWWLEHYFFYCRLIVLDELFQQMLLVPGTDISSTYGSAAVSSYHAGGGPNYTELCRDLVVRHYFREEGEDHTDHLIDSLPIASIGTELGLHTMVLDAAYSIHDPELTVGGDDAITGSEVIRLLSEWMAARDANLAEHDMQSWLRTFGVRAPKPDDDRPELVRYSRAWTYPTNHVDPTNGTPSSACSWSVTERADKKRMFKEPGFLLGVTVARPKVYFSKQTGSLSHLLTTGDHWKPWSTGIDPVDETMLKLVETGGPLPDVTDDYWIDVRDVLLHGDQLVNFALTETDAGLVAMPTAGLEKRFAASADVTALFVASGPTLIRQDGVANLGIRTTVQDRTPSASVLQAVA